MIGPMAKNKYSRYHSEIRKSLQDYANPQEALFLSRYIGSVGHEDRQGDEQSQLSFLGLKMPQIRSLAKQSYSFSHLSDEQQLPIWMSLYQESEIYDELNLAMMWMSEPKRRELLHRDIEQLWSLQDRIDNWVLSDSFSEFVAEALERQPKLIFPRMRKWNDSKNPWERRQSLVGLYCYARKRKTPFPVAQALKLVEKLVEDPHYFVQKAVGWSLREIDQVDHKAQLKFVSQNLHRLTAVAFSTAIEKYTSKEREFIKLKRAEARKRLTPGLKSSSRGRL